MTITIKKPTRVEFLKFQQDIWDIYMGSDEQYVPCYRKAWESKYDPKYIKGTTGKAPRMTPPDVSSLPAKRWVKPRFPTNLEERETFRDEMCDWLVERGSKYQACEVIIDGRAETVMLFKKANEALMFKLTWG